MSKVDENKVPTTPIKLNTTDDENENNRENTEERADSVETALTRKMYADCLVNIGRSSLARREYKRALEVLLNHRGEEIDEVIINSIGKEDVELTTEKRKNLRDCLNAVAWGVHQ